MKLKSIGFKLLYKFVDERVNAFSFKGIITTILFSDAKKLRPVEVLLWCHDNHRNAIFNGKRYAPLMDTIIDQIDGELSHITMAGHFSRFFGKSCYGNVVMYNRALLWAYLRRIVFFGKLSIQHGSKDPVVKAWIAILKKFRPKAIIGITPSPELCLAAKQLGIWIADMQHGVLAPGNFYDLTKRAYLHQAGWPDEILCWDQYSKDYVDNELAPHVASRIVGHPSLFSKANKTFADGTKEERKTDNDAEIKILVTFTSYVPDIYAEDKCFQKLGTPSTLIDFIKEHGASFKWNLRLHPVQATKRKAEVYQYLEKVLGGAQNVDWESCNNETLYDLFQKNTVHITYDSASTREAAMNGISTAILDSNETNILAYFEDIIKEKKAILLSPVNHETFKAWIIKSHEDYLEVKQKFEQEKSERRRQFIAFADNLKSRIINSRETA